MAQATSQELSVRVFAIGRLLSVAAAGRAQAHPSVRRGGASGRRSHSSTTNWALGFVSTVRIGAGAWRKSQACSNAATPVGQTHTTNLTKNTSGQEEKGTLLGSNY